MKSLFWEFNLTREFFLILTASTNFQSLLGLLASKCIRPLLLFMNNIAVFDGFRFS